MKTILLEGSGTSEQPAATHLLGIYIYIYNNLIGYVNIYVYQKGYVRRNLILIN